MGTHRLVQLIGPENENPPDRALMKTSKSPVTGNESPRHRSSSKTTLRSVSSEILFCFRYNNWSKQNQTDKVWDCHQSIQCI